MNIAKAVITAAGPTQRTLPMQTVIDRDGGEKSVLRIIVEEVLRTGVEEICLVVCPGDEQAYTAAVGDHAGRLHRSAGRAWWLRPRAALRASVCR